MLTDTLKLRKDFKFSYPYGLPAGPVIRVIRGFYKGFRIHLEQSFIETSIVNGSQNSTLNYTHKIEKAWDTAKLSENKLTLTQENQEFIHRLIYNFIRETN